MGAVVDRIELIRFEYRVDGLAPEPPLGVPVYQPGATLVRPHVAIRLSTSDGVTGAYATDRPLELDPAAMLADLVLGHDPLDREGFYQRAKHRLSIHAHLLGMGIMDCALWDLAGRHYGAPIWELLGGAPRPLPAYASTHCADRQPDGLSSPAAFADYAEACYDAGYRAFKIHPWQHAAIEEHVACVRAVADRVGDRMALMVDPFNAIRTFGEAVVLARACDELGYRWLEDPYRDGGTSIAGHHRLRQLARVPLLLPEHARSLETHVDFLRYDATDYLRGDPDWDGVTGTMKIAHAAEGFGVDLELHGSGPIRRALMAAIANTNFYELSLFHPRVEQPYHAPLHLDYEDSFASIDGDGCVSVPTGPGLGVDYDWEWIDARVTARSELRL